MHATILMGIPGSGKSTYAARWSPDEVVSPDRIRLMLTGDESDQSMNKQVFMVAHGRFRWLLTEMIAAERDGSGPRLAFFDATNVQKFARIALLDICKEFGVRAHLVCFDTPRQICMERNRNRSRVVPDHAIKRMHGFFLSALDEIENEGWDNIVVINKEVTA